LPKINFKVSQLIDLFCFIYDEALGQPYYLWRRRKQENNHDNETSLHEEYWRQTSSKIPQLNNFNTFLINIVNEIEVSLKKSVSNILHGGLFHYHDYFLASCVSKGNILIKRAGAM
jgi:hypothetical protein